MLSDLCPSLVNLALESLLVGSPLRWQSQVSQRLRDMWNLSLYKFQGPTNPAFVDVVFEFQRLLVFASGLGRLRRERIHGWRPNPAETGENPRVASKSCFLQTLV